MASKQQISLRNLRIAYISAFSLILIMAALTQTVVQVALHEVTISRQAATLESSQAVRSQRLNRDALLFLGATDHTATIKEMQSDLAGLEQTRKLFTAQYTPRYPAFATIDGGHGNGLKVYLAVYQAVQRLIAIDETHPPASVRLKLELPYISIVFYKEPEQLNNIQTALSIINADADGYISHIQLIELLFFGITVLVLMFEAVFVLRPSLQQFSVAITFGGPSSSTTTTTTTTSTTSNSSDRFSPIEPLAEPTKDIA